MKAHWLVALLPLLSGGCATVLLLNTVKDPIAVEDHFGPIQQAYRTASNELVVCMLENSKDTPFNRPFRIQLPLNGCESATNLVIVPRRFLRQRRPLPVDGWAELPVATNTVRYSDLIPPDQDYLGKPPFAVTLGTVYNINYQTTGIFAFGYGSTTTTNLVVFQLKVRNRDMRPALLFLPVTAAVDIATVPLWLWAFSKFDEEEDDLFHHHHHHRGKQASRRSHFDDD